MEFLVGTTPSSRQAMPPRAANWRSRSGWAGSRERKSKPGARLRAELDLKASEEALRTRLSRYSTEKGIVMSSSSWKIIARNPEKIELARPDAIACAEFRPARVGMWYRLVIG